MYIFAFLIKNFRSFEKLWGFPNPSINVFIGPNNCGKSTVMRALSFVLDPTINYRQPGLLTQFDFNNLNISQPIEIYIWLKPAMHHDENDEVVFDDNEKVKLAFYDKFSAWKVEYSERNTSGYPEKHPSCLLPLIIEPMQSTEEIPPHERLLAIRLSSVWNNDIEATETEVDIIDEVGNKISSLSNQYKELLGFKMIGGRRNPLYELSLSRQSILSKMLNEDEVTIALRELLNRLDNEKNLLLDKPSVNLLMQKLNNLISPELMGTMLSNIESEFSLTFLSGDLWRLRGVTTIATNLRSNSEKKFVLPLEYQGDGAQNVILITHLINLIKESNNNEIVVLEEPEQNLEPSLARWVFSEICSITHMHNDHLGQILVTTHSTAMVSELKGAESLLIFSDSLYSPDNLQKIRNWQILAARFLPPNERKKLDQYRERYVPALFSRQALIVEGSSEIGFLPVAFNYFSKGIPSENPYHLGLEIVKGDSRDQLIKHAKVLRSFGKKVHLLFDYDLDTYNKLEIQFRSHFEGDIDFITCWPKASLLPFTSGCDLEVILVKYVEPDILFKAIKFVYNDSGHPLLKENWEKACKKINDQHIIDDFPPVFGDFDINSFDLNNFTDLNIKQAFLFALLHGPHECKATNDMRAIAEFLQENNSIPDLFDDLRKKIINTMIGSNKENYGEPYLAAR